MPHMTFSSDFYIYRTVNHLIYTFKDLVSCIPQNKMVVFAGDMNGHVRSSNAGYGMVVLGTALGTLMVPGYWSLQMG